MHSAALRCPQVRQQVFEPFFTTKHSGSGTGLGLSVSHFIITELHHGQIQVDREYDRGSRFVIHLPIGTQCNDTLAGFSRTQ